MTLREAFEIIEKKYRHASKSSATLAFERISKTRATRDQARILHNLGFCYFLGLGTKSDIKKAIFYFKRAAALGSMASYFNLARLSEKGRGLPKNLKKANAYYRKAASLGDEWAQLNLGWNYFIGEGVKRNHETAKEYWLLAARKKNANAVFSLGLLYEKMPRNTKSLEKALGYFLKASELGHPKSKSKIASMKRQIEKSQL